MTHPGQTPNQPPHGQQQWGQQNPQTQWGQPQPPKKPMGKGPKVGLIIGGIFVGLVVLGSIVGPQDTKTSSKPAADKVAIAPTSKAPSVAAKQTTAEPAPKKETPAKPSPAKKAPAAPVVETAQLPNFVGMNHQDAQDTAQAAGFFNLREKDASGMERILVLDRNWKVCKQEPAAGKHGVEKTITLYSVKQSESCSGSGGSGGSSSVYYSNCDAARAAGAAPVRRGEPGYSSKLDRDGDGVACDN